MQMTGMTILSVKKNAAVRLGSRDHFRRKLSLSGSALGCKLTKLHILTAAVWLQTVFTLQELLMEETKGSKP